MTLGEPGCKVLIGWETNFASSQGKDSSKNKLGKSLNGTRNPRRANPILSGFNSDSF
jgi:hypothetical protein